MQTLIEIIGVICIIFGTFNLVTLAADGVDTSRWTPRMWVTSLTIQVVAIVVGYLLVNS